MSKWKFTQSKCTLSRTDTAKNRNRDQIAGTHTESFTREPYRHTQLLNSVSPYDNNKITQYVGLGDKEIQKKCWMP